MWPKNEFRGVGQGEGWAHKNREHCYQKRRIGDWANERMDAERPIVRAHNENDEDEDDGDDDAVDDDDDND